MHATAVGSLNAMRLLVKAGADVNAKNGLDASALIWGAVDVQKTKLLLDAGAEVNVRTKLGRTPLLMAAGRPGSSEIVRILLAKGADTTAADVRGNTPLLEAARVNDIEVLRLLAEQKVDINAGDFAGLTALGHAAAHSNMEAVRLLLKKGSQVNTAHERAIKVKNGVIAASRITALMAAVPHASIEVVEVLLDAGADVAARDIRGMTPLMLAVASDTANPQVVRLLLERGSDPPAKSTLGETALDWAKKFNHPEIVRMLGGEVSKPKLILQRTAHANTDIRKIIERSLPLLESTSVEYFKQSGCVGCHHQDVIGGALSAAARRGLRINESSLQEQMRIVKFEMLGSRETLLQSVFISVDGFAYALSMLADQDYPADEITDAIVSMIASQQTADGGWNEFPFVRPPLEASPLVVAALAVRGMVRYAIPARKAEFEERIAKARRWLAASRTDAAYEQYFRLMGLKWSSADPRIVAKGLAEVRRLQRPDGGFPQSVNLASDAFATGAALNAMREAGVSSKDSAYQRAIQFLIATQQEDGSWYVASRSPKVQPYFQSGFPHNHDQWISSAATALAIKALAESVEPAALAAR
jgi:ankyrin repeat protein